MFTLVLVGLGIQIYLHWVIWMPNIELPAWSILTELTDGRRGIPVTIFSTMD